MVNANDGLHAGMWVTDDFGTKLWLVGFSDDGKTAIVQKNGRFVRNVRGRDEYKPYIEPVKHVLRVVLMEGGGFGIAYSLEA